jgi:hypothetical protein
MRPRAPLAALGLCLPLSLPVMRSEEQSEAGRGLFLLPLGCRTRPGEAASWLPARSTALSLGRVGRGGCYALNRGRQMKGWGLGGYGGG